MNSAGQKFILMKYLGPVNSPRDPSDGSSLWQSYVPESLVCWECFGILVAFGDCNASA